MGLGRQVTQGQAAPAGILGQKVSALGSWADLGQGLGSALLYSGALSPEGSLGLGGESFHPDRANFERGSALATAPAQQAVSAVL